MIGFLTQYLSYIRWGVLIGSWIALAWATHHIDGLSVKAAQADHVETVVQSIPQVITKTQVIYRAIHETDDKCVVAPIPSAVLEQLH